jgi:hypothetical protein
MNHLHFNHWAVLVCGIALWFLGAIWYSPMLFSRPWMRLLGIDPANTNRKSMMTGIILSFIGNVLAAFILAHVILWSGAKTFAAGAVVGLVIWIGFFAAPMVPQAVFENRPFKLFLINSGYWLVGLLVIGGVLAVWQ